MAKIVLGVGTSHSPQLSVRAKDWQVLKKDETTRGWTIRTC